MTCYLQSESKDGLRWMEGLSRPHLCPSGISWTCHISINNSMSVKTIASSACFGGKLLQLVHNASTTNCVMAFNLYLPPQAVKNTSQKIPLLIYLAGLTCTGDNGAQKGFFQHKASEKGIAVLYPDTSPRGSALCALINISFLGLHPAWSWIDHEPTTSADKFSSFQLGGLNIPGEDDDYDFGTAAGFYLNATKPPWTKGYFMYNYITQELPKTVFENFKQIDSERVSLFGHSMGGHGALTIVSRDQPMDRHDSDWYQVPQEPGKIQIRLRLRTNCKPD